MLKVGLTSSRSSDSHVERSASKKSHEKPKPSIVVVSLAILIQCCQSFFCDDNCVGAMVPRIFRLRSFMETAVSVNLGSEPIHPNFANNGFRKPNVSIFGEADVNAILSLFSLCLLRGMEHSSTRRIAARPLRAQLASILHCSQCPLQSTSPRPRI